MKYYAGVGARLTPKEIQTNMTCMAEALESIGYTLRSGGAEGADKAFESGVREEEHKQIFRPKTHAPSLEAEAIASKIHPAWNLCKPYARACHGRNVCQVLGSSLKEPVEFVVCWTPDAEEVGGTRTAIVLAKQRGIPVYNLANREQFIAINNLIRKMLCDDCLLYGKELCAVCLQWVE